MSLFGEKDLLSQVIQNVDEGPSLPIRDENHNCTSGSVEVVFRDIESRVVEVISEFDTVFGCVAWLTNGRILKALAGRKDTSIILQKEDFLRPDTGGPRDAELRKMYAALPNNRGSDGDYQFGYNYASAIETESVRCVGYASDKNRTIPRMHNKFLVLGNSIPYDDLPENYHATYFLPKVVITGSFNMTENANRSLENVVIIRDETIAEAYRAEFVTIYGISEPLDWTHEYVNPHYSKAYPYNPRYGT